MPADTVKKVPFNVACINMTDWEIQYLSLVFKNFFEIGSIISGVIWDKMYTDVKVFLIALKMQEYLIISKKCLKK
jgi:hypothetical protein